MLQFARGVWGFAILSAVAGVAEALARGDVWALLFVRFLLLALAVDLARDSRELPSDQQQQICGSASAIVGVSVLIR